MNKRTVLKTFLFGLFFLIPKLYGTTRKVLFIGDSYTYVNNMPLMVKELAASLGDTLIYDESDPGGFTFEQHSSYAPTIAKIFSQQWDIVVLQEQSERPAFPPSQVALQVYPYARILDSLIHANDTCTQTMFMMTWGHANGDPANCPVYPVICTYEGMQQRLRESYMEMTEDNNAIVAPVGAAWKTIRDSFPTLELYQTDSTHASIIGSYLESCVLYSSIFHRKTSHAVYSGGLNINDAENIQHIADRVVLDSLSQWQEYGHYPNATFSYTQSGNTVTFSSSPVVQASNFWSFGDGQTANSTAPTHTYLPGTYIFSHSVSTNCFFESLSDTIHLTATGILSPYNVNQGMIYVLQSSGGYVTFKSSEAMKYDSLEIYNANGQCIRRYAFNNGIINDRFFPGFYIYRAISKDRENFRQGKWCVY